MRTDYFNVPLEVKSISDSGQLVGYGAAFGNVDEGRDLIEHGAFSGTIREHKAAGTMPGMFWAHQVKEGPIGEWKGWSEDANGLKMEGEIWIGKGIPRAEQAYLMLKSNGPKGLSIGYKVEDGGSRVDTKSRVRHLSRLGCGEVSPVPFPMNKKAGIISVKSTDNAFSFKNDDGSLLSIRDFERLLRDGGLSDSQAKAFLAGGYSRLAPRDGEKLADLVQSIKSTTLHA